MDKLKEWHVCLLVNSELVNIRDLLDCELCEDGVVFGLFKNLFWRNGPKLDCHSTCGSQLVESSSD